MRKAMIAIAAAEAQVTKVTDTWFIARTEHGVFFAESHLAVVVKAGAYAMRELDTGLSEAERAELAGYEACRTALAAGLSAWAPGMCPFPDGTPERDGWRHCLRHEADARRQAVLQHAPPEYPCVFEQRFTLID